MNNSIKTIFFISILSFTLAAFGNAENSPSQVVDRFCQLDFEGSRLSTGGHALFEDLVSYPEEPGWDTAIAINKYTILSEKIEKDSAEVVVFYEIVRTWPIKIENIERYKKEKIKLKKENNDWKISGYISYPRVDAEILCQKHHYCIEK